MANANVLVVAETRGADLRKVALEVVTGARKLADAGGGEVHALLAGPPGIAAKAQQLAQHGADVVLICENPGLARYAREALTATIAARAKEEGYRAVLLPFSAQGRDLGPRVAARLDAPIVSDIIDFSVTGDSIVVKHPGYANKVIITLAVSGSPVVLSLRPAAFTPTQNAKAGRSETISLAADPAAERVVVKDIIEGAKGKLDLGEAPIIVSGGRGLRGPENFKLVEDLAAAFGNAAVGATRAVTDEGWRPHTDQIGQTGRQVSPQLYVAIGISGAIQHLAGMRTSKTIVAINKDPEAPIFQISDLGIVGDTMKVLPALIEELEKRKGG
jgi:electron transfer flavoprotein alpha subunit